MITKIMSIGSSIDNTLTATSVASLIAWMSENITLGSFVLLTVGILNLVKAYRYFYPKKPK